MWRSIFCAVALLVCIHLWSLAGEPGSIVVVVPDPHMAAEVSAAIPGVRVAVLQVHPGEPDEVIHARAIALRNATHFVFDRSNESLRLAMFRERLQMQGAVAIPIRPSSQPLHERVKPANALQPEQLANLLAQISLNRE